MTSTKGKKNATSDDWKKLRLPYATVIKLPETSLPTETVKSIRTKANADKKYLEVQDKPKFLALTIASVDGVIIPE
jgi:hypothetical protein